jgi:hypothetical protein
MPVLAPSIASLRHDPYSSTPYTSTSAHGPTCKPNREQFTLCIVSCFAMAFCIQTVYGAASGTDRPAP